ncbi:MAG: ABC transporter substrate-binding protein, partial [Thermoanaerobaculia bacterium]
MKARVLAPALLLLPFLLAASSGLTPREENGKRIYLEGVSSSGGEITAVMGEGVEVPAAAVPCSGCHGRDGRGKPEGGVSPSDVTWSRLTRPYGATHPSGRSHPPYDERLLKRAIAMGLDPAGTPLHVAM